MEGWKDLVVFAALEFSYRSVPAEDYYKNRKKTRIVLDELLHNKITFTSTGHPIDDSPLRAICTVVSCRKDWPSFPKNVPWTRKSSAGRSWALELLLIQRKLLKKLSRPSRPRTNEVDSNLHSRDRDLAPYLVPRQKFCKLFIHGHMMDLWC